jgi:cell wall-associated NlpC family hydrolase
VSRSPARHRSDRPVSTPLDGISEALSTLVAEPAGTAGRSGLVLAVTSGLVAGVGLPANAGVHAGSRGRQQTSSQANWQTSSPAGSHPWAVPVTASPRARVVFDHSALRPELTDEATGLTTAGLTRDVARLSRSLARAAYREHIRLTAPRPAPARTSHVASGSRAAEGTHRRSGRTAPAHTQPRRTAPAHRQPVRTPAPARTTAVRPAPRPSVPTTSTAVRPSSRGAAVVALASRYLGVPYRYGGASPRGFDCSGLTQYVYGLLGVRLPRSAAQQYQATRHIPRSQAQRGDLVFFFTAGAVTHVGIYLGGNMMIAAPHTGDVVKRQAIYSANVAFGRV